MDANNRLPVFQRPPAQHQRAGTADSTIHLQDLYYVVFRHKWKIIICSSLGIIAAVCFHLFQKPVYESEAKILIKFVVSEAQTLTPAATEEVRKSPDRGGETIMATEIEILRSYDLAKKVAESVGPEKILAKAGGGKDLTAATFVVRQGLVVDMPKSTTVIRAVFRHHDAEIVQPVLRALIENYRKNHMEIHLSGGMAGDLIARQTDQLKGQLQQTEEELRKARIKAGIVTIDESKKNYASQIAHLREDLFRAQVDFAERTAALQELAKHNAAASSATPVEGSEAPPLPPADKIQAYQNIISRLTSLQTREQQLLTQFTKETPRVKEILEQISELEQQKMALEKQYPALLSSAALRPSASPNTNPGMLDLRGGSANLTALQARIKMLNTQIDEVKAEVANVDQMEIEILQLTRQKDLDDSNYRFYSTRLSQSRISEALGPGKVSNIMVFQAPSSPILDEGKTAKTTGLLAIAGILAGLAWALLIEFYLDRSVRTPLHVEKSLGLRLFLSIPRQKLKPQRRKLKSASRVEEESSGTKETTAVATTTAGAVQQDHLEELRPFHETLRDRLIGYFDRKNLVHKPKLIAVTGIGHSAGTTTVAAGLARALSETGDGNVLLVDMTAGQGSSQQFSRGKVVCDLDSVIDTRENAQVETNLYVVSDRPGEDRLSGILPRRFSKLVPKLKASNFDYIIFDMPAINQISVTLRLAGFMDMALLVVESEKTDREAVARASALLAESKADVGVVLNKTRTYLPSWLHRDQLEIA